MSTYHAPSLEAYATQLTKGIKPLQSAGLLHKYASGLAAYSRYAWENETESVSARFAQLKASRVIHVSIFVFPEPKAPWNCSASMREAWWRAVEKFVA